MHKDGFGGGVKLNRLPALSHNSIVWTPFVWTKGETALNSWPTAGNIDATVLGTALVGFRRAFHGAAWFWHVWIDLKIARCVSTLKPQCLPQSGDAFGGLRAQTASHMAVSITPMYITINITNLSTHECNTSIDSMLMS